MLIDDIFDPIKSKQKRAMDMHQNPTAPLDGLLEILRGSLPVFNLQGLRANYESQARSKQGFHFSKQVFTARPPYDAMWAEFDIPALSINEQAVRMGAYLEWSKLGEYSCSKESLVSYRKTLSTTEIENLPAVRDSADDVKLQDTYAVTASVIVDGIDIWFCYPGFVHIVCTKLGEPLTVPFASIYPTEFGAVGTLQFHLLADELREAIGKRCNLIWFALALLNCKNVETEKHAHDAKLQQARARRNKQPLRDFYRLNVRLPKSAQSRTSGQATGELRPFHTVMGHLADYREGAGLFGKHKGVFWIPAHVRGSKDAGIVNKNYALKGKEKQ